MSIGTASVKGGAKMYRSGLVFWRRFRGLSQVTRQAHRWVWGSSILLRASALRQITEISCSATKCPAATCWGLTR